MVLLPERLNAVKRVVKPVGLTLTGADLNLDAGFDATHNRPCLFKAGLIPNITANPRHRKRPNRGGHMLHELGITKPTIRDDHGRG